MQAVGGGERSDEKEEGRASGERIMMKHTERPRHR